MVQREWVSALSLSIPKAMFVVEAGSEAATGEGYLRKEVFPKRTLDTGIG
jgi:hypothetical protein